MGTARYFLLGKADEERGVDSFIFDFLYTFLGILHITVIFFLLHIFIS